MPIQFQSLRKAYTKFNRRRSPVRSAKLLYIAQLAQGRAWKPLADILYRIRKLAHPVGKHRQFLADVQGILALIWCKSALTQS